MIYKDKQHQALQSFYHCISNIFAGEGRGRNGPELSSRSKQAYSYPAST